MKLSSSLLCCLGGALIAVASLYPSAGHAFTAQQVAFDWQTKWGAIAFGKADTEDSLISSALLPPKKAIKYAIENYGTSTDSNLMSQERTYTLDVNGDNVVVNGLSDIILDGGDYFRSNGNASSTLCTATEGCYLTIYIQREPTNIITAAASATVYNPITKKTTVVPHTCPATAAKNTSCDSACAATVQNCPGLFQYNMEMAYDNRVFSWVFASAADFEKWRAARTAVLEGDALATADATGIYQSYDIYAMKSALPVLVAALPTSRCYAEELTFNNGACIKYYQYDGTKHLFVELYGHPDYSGGELTTRYSLTPFSRTASSTTRGQVVGNGFGVKLDPGSEVSIQISGFTRTNGNGTTTIAPADGVFPEGYFAARFVNNGTQGVFIPTNTDYEFSSFLNNIPASVTASDVSYRFTSWVGDTSCPAVAGQTNCAGLDDQLGTGVDTSMGAQRYCQSSTGAIMPCQACVNAKVGDYANGCVKKVVCPGPACCVHGTYYAAGSYEACSVAIAHHCVAEGQEIQLPNGQVKKIEEVKVGDVVLGFKTPTGTLRPAKVLFRTVTENETTVLINGTLAVTPSHEVVTKGGKKVLARKLQIGDAVLTETGAPLVVKTLATSPEKSTVYNLKLEGATGFVAGGVRVIAVQKGAAKVD